LHDYFTRIVEMIRASREASAYELLSHLTEPNETRLGFSRDRPRGAGIGRDQARQLLDAFSGSAAVRQGFLSALEECELMIEGIGRDKISDLTTNVIRAHLAVYTRAQCLLWDVPIRSVPLPPAYFADNGRWVSDYHELPVAAGRPVLLVPKAFTRFEPAYEHQKYYRHFVLEFLQAEHLNASSSLVRTLKNGRRVVYKKDLEEKYPCSKTFLFEFSRDHPEVLQDYKAQLAELEKRTGYKELNPGDIMIVANALVAALRSIPPGGTDAHSYHRLMMGALELLFFPSLINPNKEHEIHDGRKRIDIVMENGAARGIFHRLHDIRKLPCSFVAIECKNYGREVGNPELDQLAGRFSPLRGKLGILCCRSFEDRALFIRRCRDTLKDDRGLVLPMDNAFIISLLEAVSQGERNEVDRAMTALVDEIWHS
jgi:hypothetical protein